jgi:hypothetical protein
MNEIKITIRVQRLSDNSDAYNVELGDVLMHAVTERDAVDLAEGIAVLIQRHANDCATVHYQWAA